MGEVDAHRVTSNAKFAKETMRTKSREAIRLVSLSGSLFGAWFGAYNAIKVIGLKSCLLVVGGQRMYLTCGEPLVLSCSMGQR